MVLGMSAGEFEEGWYELDAKTPLTDRPESARSHDWLPRRSRETAEPFLHEHTVPKKREKITFPSLVYPLPQKKYYPGGQRIDGTFTQEPSKELQSCRSLLLQSAAELARLNRFEYQETHSTYNMLDKRFLRLQEKPFVSAHTVIELGVIEHEVTQLKESLILRLGSVFFKTFILDPLDHALKKLSHLRLLCSYAIVSQTNQMLKKRRVRNRRVIKKKIQDERIAEAKDGDF